MKQHPRQTMKITRFVAILGNLLLLPFSIAENAIVEMIAVPGGVFQMGVPETEKIHRGEEQPSMEVKVGDFQIQKTPVTQALWESVMGTNPSRFKDPTRPVESVTWYDAVEFCNKLSEKEGLTPVYSDYGLYGNDSSRLTMADPNANGYRLPTEAEWEYAARGAPRPGEAATIRIADPDSAGWYRGNSENQTRPVGKKAPNALGLYDMSGHVMEWTWDGFLQDLYRGARPVDPALAPRNTRTVRNSCYWNRADSMRPTLRNGMPATRAFSFVGFRLAKGPNPEIGIRMDAGKQASLLRVKSPDLSGRPYPATGDHKNIVITQPPNRTLGAIPEVEVKDHLGAPTLFINGKPNTGLMLWRHAKGGESEFADFHKAGVNLIQPDLPIGWAWKGDGTMDHARINAIFEEILRGNPDALVLPRIHIHGPHWWWTLYPNRQNEGYQRSSDRYATGEFIVNTYTDELWRERMLAATETLVRYLEAQWGDKIVGYAIGGGDTGEWAPGWVGDGEFDFNPIQTDAFRKWLGREDVDVPRDRLSDGRKDVFNDPDKDWLLSKYFEFESLATTDTLLMFNQKVRAVCKELGRKRITGAFYGYWWALFYRMGTHDFRRVLENPEIDFIASLSKYEWRGPGGLYTSTTVPGSVRLHGKILYNEDDSVTPLSKRIRPGNTSRYGPPDWWITQQLSIHKIVGSWIEGGTSWYMDWLNENWYQHPDMMQTIAETQAMLTRQLDKSRKSVAQIAVFGSEKSIRSIRPDDRFLKSWRADSQEALMRLGAPVEFYELEDLPAVLEMKQHKLLIFQDVPKMPAVKIPDHVFTWFTFLPGFSEQSASEILGFQVTQVAGKSRGEVLPKVTTQDPSAMQAGPLLWQKGNTFWSPEPPLKPEELRTVADKAGVHFYGEGGDQILVNKSLFLVHSATEGERTFRLPSAAKIRDAFTGETVAEKSDEFKATLKKGETRVWTIDF